MPTWGDSIWGGFISALIICRPYGTCLLRSLYRTPVILY